MAISGMKKKTIKIKSGLYKGLSAKINLAGEVYLVDSEDLGIERHIIVTRIYHKGEIVSSHEFDYAGILNEPAFDKRLTEVIQKQQHQAIQAFKLGEIAQNKTYGDYVKKAETLIRSNNQKDALKLLTGAMEHYAKNPFIVSYQGFLEATVNKNYSKGVTTCREAFKILKEQVPFGEEFFFPILYLNLGKAYLAANKRKEAYASFQKGLEIDKENRDLICELKKLGMRRKPFFPFFKRSNPLNKYIGKLSNRLKKQKSLAS